MPQEQVAYDPLTGKPLATQPPPSAFERFGTSLWNQIDPIAAVQGVRTALRHPIDTGISIATSTLTKRAEAQKQAEAGNWGDAMVSTIGAVPLVGQPVELGINQVREGDYAGAAGTAVGLAVPYTRPLKTLGRAGLATAKAVAPAWTEAAAGRLGKIAASKVADVMAPKVGANKTRIANDAAKVAPAMLERDLANVWSREGLHDNVVAGLEAAKSKLDDAADARQSWKSYPTQDIIDALQAKKREVQGEAIQASKWPRTIDPETNLPMTEAYGYSATPKPVQQRVANIESAIMEVQGLGETATYEALRKLRAGWDVEAKPVYSSAITPDYVKNVSGKMGAADVTSTLREYLAAKDPTTAAANAEYSLFRRANDVLEATQEVERARPAAGRRIISRVSGSIVGSQVAGLMGAIIGYAIAPAAEVSVGMGVTSKLKVATKMKQLADAIRSGNASGVEFYSKQLRRTLGQAGVMIENQQEASAMTPVPSHAPTTTIMPSHTTTPALEVTRADLEVVAKMNGTTVDVEAARAKAEGYAIR